MSRVLVTEQHLSDIAYAIRSKLEGSDTYRPGEMAAAIREIDTSGIHPAGTVNITQNGAHDVTQYASANVNVHPNLQSKTATQNGTVTPDSGYDGLSSVVVNVSGGGGTIIYGTDEPAASQGSDGDVYFKYEAFNYASLLPSEDANLNDWLKNTAVFTQFDNTYNAGENTLIQIGGSGYERIYVPMSLTQNTDYVFGMKYYSPSGVAGGYSGGQLALGISYASQSTMRDTSAISLTSKTNLSLTADSGYSDYSLSFNSGSHTSVYLVIDLNITDGRQCTLKFKDIVFYKAGEPPVAVDGKIIRKAYLKQSGAWVDVIGATIID